MGKGFAAPPDTDAGVGAAATGGSFPSAVEIETPGLNRALRSRHVAMISIGGIIGAGLFVGSSASIASVGPAIVISYVLAGALILCVMRMLGEMATAHPEIGSFTEYSRLSLGPWAGFTTGWLYWYFWAIVVGIETIAGSTLLHQWIPLPPWEIGLGLLAIMTGVNLMSTRSYGEFEFWFASIKVSAIAVFIVIAALWASGLTSPSGPTFSNLYTHGGFAPFGPVSVLAGVTSVIFALCGAEIATIAAAETPDPGPIIAKLTMSVAMRIALFFVGSMALIVSVVPWDQIKPGFSPFTTALNVMHVPAAALIMDFVVLTAVLSCLNSGLYVTSRVLFTLAAHGDAPRALVVLNRRRVPSRAILIGSAFGFAAVIASKVSPQLVFAFLVNASGAIMILIYLVITAAQIRLRRRLEASAPEKLGVKMWLFPWLSYAVIAAMLAVLAAMAAIPDHRAEFYASMAFLAVVLGAYAGVRWRRSVVAP
jgi:L-asparagine transporter-like permease